MFDFWIHDPDGRSEAVIRVTTPNPNNPFGATWTWTGRTQLASSSTWSHVTNLMSRTWTWYPPPPGPFNPGEQVPLLATVDGFAAGSTGSGPATVSVERQRCTGAQPTGSTTHIDALTITTTGEAANTLNFEEPPIDILIGANETTLPPGGGPLTIYGEAYSDEEQFGADLPFRLMHSTNGTDFTELTTVTANGAGFWNATVSPTVTTWYRWDYSGSLDRAPASSGRLQIVVKRQPALTISSIRSIITEGEPLDLSTTATIDGSAAPGISVVLRKSVDDGATWSDVTTVVTNATGQATATVSPTESTAYRWHIAGNTFLAPAQSPRKNITVRLRTQITASATPTTIDHGGTSTIGGVITIGGSPAEFAQVELWGASGTGFPNTLITTVTSNSSGQLAYDVTLTQSRRYEWRYAATDQHSSATSPTALVSVRRPTVLTMTATATDLRPGHQVTLSTTLRSDGALVSGRSVALYKSTNETTWTLVATRSTDAAGAASAQFTPSATATYRWEHQRTGTLGPATSPTKQVFVRTVTALTVDASADSVAPGESTTLRTTLLSGGAPVHGEIVKLLASTDGGTSWAVVGTRSTNAAGNAAQGVSPAVDTRYQWVFEASTAYASSRSPMTTVIVRQPLVPTALDNTVEGSFLYVGQSGTVRATLTAAGEPRPNRMLKLEFSEDGGVTWNTMTNRFTDVNGQVTVRVTPIRTTRFRWRFAGAANYEASQSAAKIVTVAPKRAAVMTNSAEAAVIDSGAKAQLSTTLTANGLAYPGQTVRLQRTRAGTSDWQTVASVVTGAGGFAKALVSQDVTMSYRWTYPGDDTTNAATSGTKTVEARFVVTAIASPPATAADRLFVTGLVSRNTGEPVRLMRVTGSTPVQLTTATVRADGTYQLAIKLPAGTYKVFVEVGPDDLNARGRSPDLDVVIPN